VEDRYMFRPETLYNIEFKKVESIEEKIYVKECFKQKDFQMFIGIDEKVACEFMIIRNSKQKLGIFCPNIKVNLGIKNAIPIVYMSYRKSIYTMLVMNSIIKYLFSNKKVERVEVRVLDVNSQMLQLIKKTPFIYEGYLENRCVYKNNYIGMHYYSLLEYEFERLLKNSESDREL